MADYQLRSCVWEITLACSFSCKYCGSNGGRARDNELNTDECIDVAHQLSELGCTRVSLIGGEVFMRPDWSEIIEALTKLNITVNVITNGFLFGPGQLRRLKSLNIESVSVSIDGTKQIHDKYRRTGSFERALQAIDEISSEGIPVSVISTLNSENVATLEELYRILSGKNIFAWQLQACSPMGNAANTGIDYRFNPLEVIGFVERYRSSAPFLLGIADNIGYYTPTEGYLRGNPYGKGHFAGCSAGLRSIGIDSVGNVRGCESMYDDRFIEGNLRDRSLKDIWEDEHAFEYNRKFSPSRLSGKCSSCEMGIYCAGGCRSYNYFVHNKLYEAPSCARNMEKATFPKDM